MDGRERTKDRRKERTEDKRGRTKERKEGQKGKREIKWQKKGGGERKNTSVSVTHVAHTCSTQMYVE